MAARQFIRLVRGTYRRKAFGTESRSSYSADAIVAFYGCMELAAEQPERGRFESLDLLRVLLAGPDGKGRRYARQVSFLVQQADLVRLPDGRWYLDGWDELQEGDLSVADRVSRHRERHRNGAANADVTVPTVTSVTVTSVSSRTPPRTRATRPSAPALDGWTAGRLDGGRRDGAPARDPGGTGVNDEEEGVPWIDPPPDALADVVTHLARTRGAVDPGGKAYVELARMVDRHGADAVIAAVDRLPPDVREGRAVVWSVLRVLDPIHEPARGGKPKGGHTRTEEEVDRAFT